MQDPHQNRLMEYHMSDDATDKAVFSYEYGNTGSITKKEVYENNTLLETTDYTYRHDGMLATVKVGNNDLVSFTYDAEGRRASMSVASYPVYFDYDGGSVIAERPDWGYINRSYLPGISTTDELDQNHPTQYYHADAHGSNTMMTDADGDPAAREVYDAWGNTISVTSGGTGRFGYGGEYGYRSDDGVPGSWQDAPVTGGIIQCGVRYYDPDIGRFLQQDPIGIAGGLNLYAYCGNDPVNGVDPLGLYQSYETQHQMASDFWSDAMKHFQKGGAQQGKGGGLMVGGAVALLGAFYCMKSDSLYTKIVGRAGQIGAASMIIGGAVDVLSGYGNMIVGAAEVIDAGYAEYVGFWSPGGAGARLMGDPTQ